MIVLKAEQVGKARPSDLVEQIIANLKTAKELDLVGVGPAVFLACTTVKLAIDVTNIGISELGIEYVEHPVLGRFEAIVFTLSKENKIDLEGKATELDAQMDLVIQQGFESQLVTVSRDVNTEKIAFMSLYKLRSLDRIKVVGAGGAINTAVSAALMLVKGGFAKESVGVELISLSSVEGMGDKSGKKTTGINIYLRKGYSATPSPHYVQLLEQLNSGRV